MNRHATGLQLDNMWTRLLTMSHDLALGHSKEPRAAARNVAQARGLLADLHRGTMLNRSLHREHTVVSYMSQCLEVVLKMKKGGKLGWQPRTSTDN